MGEIRFLVKASTVIHCDNQSAIQVAYNPVAHSKMKHVELHCHYLRQLVQEKDVILVYCRIEDQIADIFKKPLLEVKFIRLCSFLGLQETTIMGGCPTVILSFESPKCCVDGWGEGGVVGT